MVRGAAMFRSMVGVALAGSVLLGAVAGAHEMAGAAPGPMTLTPHDLLRYLHVVLLVFWLGPDVAITIAGTWAANAQLNPAQRAGAARMAEYYAIMPRVCMSLMLTVGGILSEQVGLEHPWWQMAGIVLLGPVWLTLTLLAYFGSGDAGAWATRLERWLRIALIVSIPASVTYSTVTGRLAEAPYIGGKLILFALILVLGLLAQRAFAPYLQGVKELARGVTSPALDETLRASFARGRRVVIVTWLALLMAAFMGVVQPGVPDEEQQARAVPRD